MLRGGTVDCGLQKLFVKPFQDELQKATSDYATSKERDEYSDDFESDEDSKFNDTRKELTESNSGSASSERSVAGSLLLNDDALQKAIGLENEAADDLNLSFLEKKLQQIMVLEGENIQDDRKDGEEGYLEGQNEDNDRKNNEELLCDNSESDDLPINEPNKKRNQEENQSKAKPQKHKKGNASLSDPDQKIVSTSDLKLEENGRKSLSVDSSDGMLKITKGQIITDTMQEVSVSDPSEHGEAKNTSKNSVKKLSETKERVLQNPKASLSDRSTTFVHLKRKGKAVPSTSPASSHYLGSLKVLEDKCMQKKSPEFNKVDNLRAAVFQAFKKWKERKVEYLREQSKKEKQSERMRKKIEEDLVAEKRRVSVSAVEKWNEKKKEYIKKKKVEKLIEKRKREMQQAKKEERSEKAMEEYERWLPDQVFLTELDLQIYVDKELKGTG
ncbi:microtubule associated protein 9 [Turdus rufiventris]|nr:microtubule associated protein 9 [Turdus rufiventris]